MMIQPIAPYQAEKLAHLKSHMPPIFSYGKGRLNIHITETSVKTIACIARPCKLNAFGKGTIIISQA
jgi:hypothetical protein